MITQTVDLNLIPNSAPVVIHCDQYDTGTGRLIFNLYNEYVAYSPVGTAVIQGTKPDNHGFNYNCTMVGNVVTADLTAQMSIVAGRVRCQIVVTESSGRTGSFAFILDVQKSALPANSDMSASDYQLIQQAINDTAQYASDAEDSAEDAEAWAVGERNGVPVTSGDETYQNNSKYWSDISQQYAQGGLHYKGSVTFANIPVAGLSVGDMYNIEDDFTTDNRFQEGSGVKAKAGTNIAYNSNSKWDILATSMLDSVTLYGETEITSGSADLNSYTTVGNYYKTATNFAPTHTPVSSSNSLKFRLLVEKMGDSNSTVIRQTFYQDNSVEFVYSRRYSGSWSPWQRYLTSLCGINDLQDVSLSSVQDGQALVYDSNSTSWKNKKIVDADAVHWEDNGVLGAKNLLLNNATSKTANGGTFTVNTDGSVTVTTANSFSANSFLNMGFFKLKKGSYILSQGVATGDNGCRIQLADEGTNVVAYITSGNATQIGFTLNEDKVVEGVIRIPSGWNTSTITFYPMLRLATDTDDTYQPYAMTNQELTEEVSALTVTDITNSYFGTMPANVTKRSGTKIYTIGKLVVVNAVIYKSDGFASATDVSIPMSSNYSPTEYINGGCYFGTGEWATSQVGYIFVDKYSSTTHNFNVKCPVSGMSYAKINLCYVMP